MFNRNKYNPHRLSAKSFVCTNLIYTFVSIKIGVRDEDKNRIH